MNFLTEKYLSLNSPFFFTLSSCTVTGLVDADVNFALKTMALSNMRDKQINK